MNDLVHPVPVMLIGTTAALEQQVVGWALPPQWRRGDDIWNKKKMIRAVYIGVTVGDWSRNRTYIWGNVVPW